MTDNVPEMITIEKSLLVEISNLLADGLSDASQLLQEHDEIYGRTIRKNKILAETYEKQIKDYDRVIDVVKGELGL